MVRQHDVTNDLMNEVDDKNSIIDIKDDSHKKEIKETSQKKSNCIIY